MSVTPVQRFPVLRKQFRDCLPVRFCYSTVRMGQALIDSYEVKMATPDCHPGATSFNIFIALQDDISEVLPYLNTTLEGHTDYRHEDGILLWAGGEKQHAFRPHEIAVGSFAEDEDGAGYAKRIVEQVNNIWSRREEITPSIKGIDPLPRVLDLYKLLPRTNCGECGFPTCMAYAVALRADADKVSLCQGLTAQDFWKALP